MAYGWILATFFIGTILLLIGLTYFLYYYNLVNSCRNNPNYWCWIDWECPGESDPARQFPAQAVYGCDGTRPRDANYCVDAPPNTPGCICSFVTGDGEIPAGCTCEWNTSEFGSCGQKYCNAVNTENCNT